MKWQWVQTGLLICIVALQIVSLADTTRESDYKFCVEKRANKYLSGTTATLSGDVEKDRIAAEGWAAGVCKDI